MAKFLVTLAAVAARLLPASLKRAIYRVGPLARLLRSGLNRSVPPGIQAVEIAGGALQGLRMALDLGAEKDYWLGTYEPDLQQAVKALAQPGMVAYDVGANIGYISLLLARAVTPGGKVISMEALPQNVERLRENIRLNQLDGAVLVIPVAVVDRPGPVTFLVGPSDDTGKVQGSAGRQGMEYAEAITVEGITLDEYVFNQDNPPPQLVKMDIEGGEVLALPGMRRLLRELRPVVLLELHGPEAARLAWDEFSQGGYQVRRMQRGFPRVQSLAALDWKAYLVALPGSEAG